VQASACTGAGRLLGPVVAGADSPCAAPYFRECVSAADLDDLNIEIIRNTLYKAYLEDFYHFCVGLG